MKHILLLSILLAVGNPGLASGQTGNCYNCFSDGTYLYCSLLQPYGGTSCSQHSPYDCTLTGACGQGGGCFLAGTLVPTEDGLMTIESLQIDSVVRSLDENGHRITARVAKTFKSIECGYYVINGTIRVTGTHPFLVEGRWVQAAQLKVGDELAGIDGPVAIASLTKMDGVVRAYNISVDGSHTFLAGGVLVHNKGPDPNN